ncbi:type II secretion system minor pseudopilin GspI [Bordetella genomosp. 11]|uniref:Type II secretion system protein I n=1 Tax=Bordetella genomosp. 11 TaxID=1416808 RepID=A0A261UNY5_9BORD|nr:type II secretion system minor pseudopilin GspI [Bordetella genomosp. 11]OZI63082.1 type II secretion system protein GspI [Bordetella genomosp. 11]
MNPRSAQTGFSLLEILIALAIIAIALAACVRAAGQIATGQAQLRDRALALVSAENTLAELRAQRAFPPLGDLRTPCPQGPSAFVCISHIESTAYKEMRQVTVRVLAQGQGPQLAQLRGLLSARP